MYNLVIGNKLFNHKYIHVTTWTSPDLVTENHIDHTAISHKWRGSLMDVRNKRGADIASDRHLISEVVWLKVATLGKDSGQKAQKNFEVEKLKVRATCTRFTIFPGPLRQIAHLQMNGIR